MPSLRHANVINLVGNAFVAKGFENFGALNEKNTWKLERITNDLAHSVSEHDPLAKFAFPYLQSKELREASPLKREDLVELLFRIAHTRLVIEAKSGKELDGLRFVAHVYERQLRSPRGNL